MQRQPAEEISYQLSRAEPRGRDIRSFYPRRLWILFGAGILLWMGNILRIYALLGFGLLAFYVSVPTVPC